jgi:hypothetical protein
MKLLEEKLMRFAAPALYEKMVEAFEDLHIHPYEIHATVIKNENGMDVCLRFSADYSQSITNHFDNEQVMQPDEEVNLFFQNAANQCKALLIADYYKMMKP